jgi:hypothetical protein
MASSWPASDLPRGRHLDPRRFCHVDAKNIRKYCDASFAAACDIDATQVPRNHEVEVADMGVVRGKEDALLGSDTGEDQAPDTEMLE